MSVRKLRNFTSEVLREVEQGGRVEITVGRRPVAELVPLSSGAWVPAGGAWQKIARNQADPGLRGDLDEALSQTTDEL